MPSKAAALSIIGSLIFMSQGALGFAGIRASAPVTRSVCDRAALVDPSFRLEKISLPSNSRLFDLSKEDRLDIVCQFRKAVLDQYTLIDLKQQRIGLDIPSHLEQCARKEMQTEDKNRLDFVDRMHLCTAAFQDTHFNVHPLRPSPFVSTLFELAFVKDKVIIGSHSVRMMQLAQQVSGDSNFTASLAVGTEVVSIEGIPVMDFVRDLAQYISASSSAYRMQQATKAVTLRNFRYPTKKYLEINVRKEDGKIHAVRTPWFRSAGEGTALDANQQLERIGILPLMGFKMEFDINERVWKKVDDPGTSFNNDTPLLPGRVLQKFQTERGQPVLAIGEATLPLSILNTQRPLKNRTFCYLQISSFYIQDDVVFDSEKQKESLVSIIKGFAEGCEEKALPVVIDLRANGGGNARIPEIVLSHFMPKDSKIIGTVDGVRVTRNSINMVSASLNTLDLEITSSMENDFLRKRFKAIREAAEQDLEYTDIHANTQTKPALENGFNQNVIALITPDCISACDMMSGLLKANANIDGKKRIHVIGTHTNGTGAGYFSMGRINTSFADPTGTLRSFIPNFLFGIAPSNEFTTGSYEETKAHIMENQPVAADIQYEASVEDMKAKGRGWLRQIAEIMQKME